ncbi:hypothetical protein N9M57_04815 [Opitutales bacterium]|jgi:hypothetical protein|nr:hypothetical protein [Opitutales bacterium]
MNKFDTTPCIVSVSEDGENFLVQIPPIHRLRAKNIKPSRWDPRKRAWVYEKTLYLYTHLKEEFEKDAVEFSITKPKRKEKKEEPKENEEFYEENVPDVEQSIQEPNESKMDELIDTIKAQNSLLESIHKDVSKERKENETEDSINAEHCNILLRAMFFSAATLDEETKLKFSAYDFFSNQDYVLNRFEEHTKTRLRELLDIDAEEKLPIFKLISEAYDTQAINRDTSNLLHQFRKERNSHTHDDEPIVRKYVRYINALSSLSLAWNAITLQS